MVECEECGEFFENGRVKSNHVRWKHRGSYSKEGLESIKEKLAIRNNKKYGDLIEEEVFCNKCHKKIIIKHRDKKKEKYFCSRNCANSRDMKNILTEESKRKISDKIKKCWQDPDYAEKCLRNNGKFFTSKREVEIRDYFIKNFPDDGWTFGGNLKLENTSCSRDLYSDKLKICFEYDGIWHFKNIYDQLENKKCKDILLESWCIKNKYKLVRVDSDENLSLEEIENLIYKDKRKTIKIGKRY
jgi:hypothetical protein